MKKLLPAVFVICALFACKQGSTPTTNAAVVDSTKSGGPHRISKEIAQMLVNNYKPHIGQRTKPDGKPVDDSGNTTSVWFDLVKLDSLVSELKAERLKNNKTDGIRIYFARYGDNAAIKFDTVNSYRNTLVVVSTKDSLYNGRKVHYDYFTKDKAFILTEPTNKGELCPPPTKCNLAGATLTP